MKRYTIFRPIRITELLAAQYDIAAAKAQVSFSEWARQALQQKWESEHRRTSKRKTA